MIEVPKHWRLVLTLTTVSVLASALSASSDVLTREWVRVYDSGDFDQLVDVRRAPNGNIYALLNVSRRGVDEDLRLLCYDPGGTLLWHSEPGLGFGAALAVDHLSRAVIAGRTHPSETDPDALVLQYGPDGRMLWRFVHPFNTAQWDYLTAVGVDQYGTVSAAGDCDNCWNSDRSQPVFVRLSPNGTPECSQRIDVHVNRYVKHLALDPGATRRDNGISAFAAGVYDNGSFEPFMMAFTATCDANWLHDLPTGRINALIAAGDGAVFASGTIQGANSFDVALFEYRGRFGELYSVTTLDVEGGSDAALGMAGRYLVGYGTTKAGGRDILTARISLPGSIDWVDVVDLSEGADDSAVDVTVLGSNYIATLATSHHQEMVTLLYASNGNMLALDSFSGLSADRPTMSVAIDNDGANHVYAGGNISGDVALIQYRIGAEVGNDPAQTWHPIPPREAGLAASPIPARGPIAITYELPERLPVRLRVLDVTGRVVRTLDETIRDEGVWDVTWDGNTSNGVPGRSGVYFLDFLAGRNHIIRRLVIVR